MPHPFGSVQRPVLRHLADAPGSPGSDVFEQRAVARAIEARRQPAVSRAVHSRQWGCPNAFRAGAELHQQGAGLGRGGAAGPGAQALFRHHHAQSDMAEFERAKEYIAKIDALLQTVN